MVTANMLSLSHTKRWVASYKRGRLPMKEKLYEDYISRWKLLFIYKQLICLHSKAADQQAACEQREANQ